MSYKDYIGEKTSLNGVEIILTNYIACGGNSVVFECQYKSNKYIIKFFKGHKRRRYERFRLEVDKIKQINKEIELENKKSKELENQAEYKNSPENIEKIARDKLGMVKSDEIIFYDEN